MTVMLDSRMLTPRLQ